MRARISVSQDNPMNYQMRLSMNNNHFLRVVVFCLAVTRRNIAVSIRSFKLIYAPYESVGVM